MKYYHVNDGSIVSMPFELSLEGGLFYDDSRELPGERYYQYCTAIPVGTLLAQTWNRELIREVGAMIGIEMEHFRSNTLVGTGNEYPQKSSLRKKLRILFRRPVCIRNHCGSYDRRCSVQLWMWNDHQTFCLQQSGRQSYGIRQCCV